MIARKVCLYSRDNVSPAVAATQSSMLPIDRSDANRTGIAEQSVKGTQRG